MGWVEISYRRWQPVSWRSIRPKLSQNSSELTIDLRHSFERVCDRDMKLTEDILPRMPTISILSLLARSPASFEPTFKLLRKLLAWRPTRVIR